MTMRSLVIRLVASMLIAGAAVVPVQVAAGGQSFASALQLAADQREAAYRGMTFQPADWQVGTVVSRTPLGVVTAAYGNLGADSYYQLQIWQGVSSRVVNDLLTRWDILRIDTAGNVTDAWIGYDRAIPNYFQQPSQLVYRTADDAERYPWADIPTDKEAKAAKIQPVPNDGMFDAYGIMPQDGSVELSSQQRKIAPLLALPAQLPATAPERSAVASAPEPAADTGPVPADIADHWAKDVIVDLMKRGIVRGYDDGTIRPDRQLSRAEFTAMLVRSLQLAPIGDGGADDLGDIAGHWAAPEISLAAEARLVQADMLPFQPDVPITRTEMARIAGRALHGIGYRVSRDKTAAPVTLSDLSGVSVDDAASIADLAAAGIVGGYPDGTFRPDGTLTRAEACKVISILLQKQGS
ncbi:S-layer homology domain-containing protein [Paenibacillus cymbidii]|uniref:S-layer homology domain-containing protein n=1 Tax=Paenibacillus cymbidii TaxID=1639034 RepID=UPI001080A9C4|nr:S-layer homology domain-containing protein [Paenibacillus cymbidii]